MRDERSRCAPPAHEHANGAKRIAETSPNEVERLKWMPVADVRKLIRLGQADGSLLTLLLWALEAEELTGPRRA